MRAVQVIEPTGPADVQLVEVDEPHARDDEVLIEVHRVGISFPDLLLSKGEYQIKPEPPFTLGVDFAGTVISGPDGYEKGERVAARSRTAAQRSWCRPRRCRCSRCPTT